MNQTIVQQPTIRKYNCPFCGGRVEGRPSANGLSSMTCPNCGGILSEGDAIDEPVQQVVQTQTYSQPAAAPQTYTRAPEQPYYPRQSFGDKLKSCFGTILAFVIIGAIAFGGFKFYEWYDGRHQYSQPYYDDGYYDERPEQHDPVYVPALGRDVPWDSEYDSYYDRQTDCYFFLNTDMDPPIWQYWFEGVSSDYGDYGWLEWDAKESRWYVQIRENQWEPLPEGKGTGLWHFD